MLICLIQTNRIHLAFINKEICKILTILTKVELVAAIELVGNGKEVVDDRVGIRLVVLLIVVVVVTKSVNDCEEILSLVLVSMVELVEVRCIEDPMIELMIFKVVELTVGNV
jgi:hypothetical protein